MTIKLLLACGDAAMANALCTKLVNASGGEIFGEAIEIPALLERAAATQPEVVMLEHVSGQEERTWNVLAQLERLSPGTPVLLLCDVYTHLTVVGSVQRGAKGCLLKLSDSWLYVKAVHAVSRGDTWYGRMALLQALQSQVCAPSRQHAQLGEGPLTRRQEEIMDLIGCGLSNKEIARRLEISDKTVKTHLHRIYVKVNRSGRYKAFLTKPESRDAIGRQ